MSPTQPDEIFEEPFKKVFLKPQKKTSLKLPRKPITLPSLKFNFLSPHSTLMAQKTLTKSSSMSLTKMALHFLHITFVRWKEKFWLVHSTIIWHTFHGETVYNNKWISIVYKCSSKPWVNSFFLYTIYVMRLIGFLVHSVVCHCHLAFAWWRYDHHA